MPTPPSPEQAAAAGEAIANGLTKRAVLTARYDADLSRRILGLLVDLEGDLRGQIARIDPGGVARKSARAVRLQTLLAETQASIRATYRRIKLLTERELAEVMAIEAKATGAVVRESLTQLEYAFRPSLPTPTYLANLAAEHMVMGEPLRDWWDRQAASVQSAVAREVRLGLAAGETVDQMARRLNPQAFARLVDRRTAAGDIDAAESRGVMVAARRNARAVVRTAANSAGNTARQAVYEANADVVSALQHLSRLDSRTTAICISRAGKMWALASKAPIDHVIPFAVPPLHVNCRSVLVPVIVGGGPATDQSGDAFFKSLSTEEQEAVFGKGKAELFRRGDITASDLVDQSGRPITLRQLREEHA